MNRPVIVELDRLERTANRLIAAIRASNRSGLRLADDYFWSIPLDHFMDVTSMPPELGIGQISECIGWLESLDKDASTALPYHLAALGYVLVALGASLAADFSVPHESKE